MNNKKPTILEQYWKLRFDFQEMYKETMPAPVQLWYYQELLYRIEILEVFKQFKDAAPLSSEPNIFKTHYQVVDMYVENLKKDRNLPEAPDGEIKKQRETALACLNSVVNDYRKRYGSYGPKSPEQYQKDIGNTIGTFLPAWLQYRNTIKEIKLTEEKA